MICDLPEFPASKTDVTRTPVAVLASLAKVGGEYFATPFQLKKGFLERRGKSTPQLSNGTYESISVIFSQSNVRVTRGHQRSKFDIYVMTFFRKRAVVSETMVARKTQGIAIDGLELLFR